MKKKQIAITLGIMCFVLTIAICVQIKTMNVANSTVSRSFADNGLRDQVLKMKEKYDNAYAELENAQKELEKVRQEATQNDENAERKEQELKENNMLLGNIDVKGEGVQIDLQDATATESALNVSDQIVHYNDIQSIVNELKNAGAEAIEINGERIVNTTSITCEGNIIKVNGERIGSPFCIKAIGSKDLLYGSLERAGSYLDFLRGRGLIVSIKKMDEVVIKKYSGIIDYEYIKEDK